LPFDKSGLKRPVVYLTAGGAGAVAGAGVGAGAGAGAGNAAGAAGAFTEAQAAGAQAAGAQVAGAQDRTLRSRFTLTLTHATSQAGAQATTGA